MKSVDEAKAEAAEQEQAASDAENSTEATEEETEATTKFDTETAEKATQNVMALAKKTNTENNETHTNNLLVIGGMSLVDPNLTSSATYNNAEFIVNAINQICGKENGIIIAEKSLTQTTIDITAAQITTIRRIIEYVIPLIVIAAGIFVYVWRKNR